MLNYDAEAVRREHQNGVDIIPETEQAVDAVCAQGYDNILYVGIGGTEFYAHQLVMVAKELGSTLPLYLENAADLVAMGSPFLTNKSLVVVETISGDTEELVQALDLAKKAGARVIGYAEKNPSPVADRCDHVITTTGGGYYFWYTVTLRLMKNAGMYPDYEGFMAALRKMPSLVNGIYEAADAKSEAWAEAVQDEPLTYLVGAGNLESWAHCYGMCIMEEMQWMRTRTVSAANFFHGTLEVIERDVPVLLVFGEDAARPLMERVERFVNKVSAKVAKFDTQDFALEGIDGQYRGMLSPIVMRSAFQRISAHLEHKRRHPLPIRRYYRRLDY